MVAIGRSWERHGVLIVVHREIEGEAGGGWNQMVAIDRESTTAERYSQCKQIISPPTPDTVGPRDQHRIHTSLGKTD